MPEEDRPGQVMVPILTYGFENASRKFTWADISKKITLQRDTFKWVFLFLGANQDAIATAAQTLLVGVQIETCQLDRSDTLNPKRGPLPLRLLIVLVTNLHFGPHPSGQEPVIIFDVALGDVDVFVPEVKTLGPEFIILSEVADGDFVYESMAFFLPGGNWTRWFALGLGLTA